MGRFEMMILIFSITVTLLVAAAYLLTPPAPLVRLVEPWDCPWKPIPTQCASCNRVLRERRESGVMADGKGYCDMDCYGAWIRAEYRAKELRYQERQVQTKGKLGRMEREPVGDLDKDSVGGEGLTGPLDPVD